MRRLDARQAAAVRGQHLVPNAADGTHLAERNALARHGQVQRLLDCLAPGRERLPASGPQHRHDDGRQYAPLPHGREHPIVARFEPDERASRGRRSIRRDNA